MNEEYLLERETQVYTYRAVPVLYNGQPDRSMHAGDIVRHFKGGLYKIVGLATDTETQERVVVYQSLSGSTKGSVYVRPCDMFFSPVDREKYPDATQQYRLEKITLSVL